MATYGKALSTYKRINNIKRSSEKIAEARSIGRREQMKALRAAQDAQMRGNIASAIGEAVVTGGSYAMSQSNSITPEMNRNITMGANVASEGISSIFSNPGDNANAHLDRRSFEYFKNQNDPDFLKAGLEGYQLSDSFEQMRKMKDFDNASDQLEDNRYGLTVDQMRNYTDEVEFEKGSGYDFSKLPDITKQRINTILQTSGIGVENFDQFTDPYNKNNQPDDPFDIGHMDSNFKSFT